MIAGGFVARQFQTFCNRESLGSRVSSFPKVEV